MFVFTNKAKRKRAGGKGRPRWVLVHRGKMMSVEIALHRHPYEQLTYVRTGRGDETHEVSLETGSINSQTPFTAASV
ncbi:hypothetical protein [Kosakonia sp. S42]|uniref:hypothetical protein n=1 Tax=Kosakonia sp. S42 TaxID=2767458 RepID=UPI00190A29C6|nr:hypothetical protein [Kosakonia sp. S42]MBK0018757.1 hypothetical protein [Kosakonia sp. S42]